MTPEQVVAATGTPLSRGNSGLRLDGKQVGNVGEYRSTEGRFQTVYYFDDAGLAHIALYHKSGKCSDVVNFLAATYGEPVRISDQAILRLVIWHDRGSATRVRLLLSASICDVNYERLSDYESIDLEAKTPGS